MSGGLDSSVAAYLMREAGHEVVGVFFRLWDPLAGHASRCCSLEDLEDARRVAQELGIPLREECSTRRFFDEVFEASLERYVEGLTPNPCVVCNARVKFPELVRVAEEEGAEFMVTGHYARLEHGPGGPRLHRGAVREKDQSYFLHRLGRDLLERLRFPVGGMGKEEVRDLALASGLSVASKRESQELCFVPPGTSCADLVERWKGDSIRPGPIVDREGRVLGEHRGVHRFTIGQRRGIGVSAEAPLYVLATRREDAAVVVGPREALETWRIGVRDIVWVRGAPPAGRFACTVQVRSRHGGTPAVVDVEGSGATVTVEEPLRGPAPGQAAVFYDGDEVLGGGWIVGG